MGWQNILSCFHNLFILEIVFIVSRTKWTHFFFIVPFGLSMFDLFVVPCLTWKVQDFHKCWARGKLYKFIFMVTTNNTLSKRRRNYLKYLANLNRTLYSWGKWGEKSQGLRRLISLKCFHIPSFLIFQLNFSPKQKQDFKAFLFLQEGINNLFLNVLLQGPAARIKLSLSVEEKTHPSVLESESSICSVPSMHCLHQHTALPSENFLTDKSLK